MPTSVTTLSSVCITFALIVAGIACEHEGQSVLRRNPETASAQPPRVLNQLPVHDDNAAAYTTGMQADFATVDRLNRQLINAMTDPEQDPARYVMPHNFTLTDGSQPARTVWRHVLSGPVYGQDFFRFVNQILTPAHRTIKQVEMFAQQAGWIIVITTHDRAAPTLATWQRRGDEWKALRMTINAQDSLVNAVRKHYSVRAPYAAGFR